MGGPLHRTAFFVAFRHKKNARILLRAECGRFSLSKNYPNAPVSAIIEETGVFSWKAGEKMHGMSQSS